MRIAPAIICLAAAMPILALAQETADAPPAAATAPDAPAATAAQEQDVQKKLDAIHAQIATLTAQQQAATDRRSAAARALREKELALAAAAKDMHAFDARLAAQQGQLDGLEKQRSMLETRFAAQRRELAALLRSAYALDHGEELKLLLQQEDVATTARVLAYHRYFQRAQIERIDTLRGQLKQLTDLRASIQAATAQLQAMREARNASSARLETERSERAALVASLDTRLKDSHARIDALGKDEAAVTQILEHLHGAPEDVPAQGADQESFAAQRGRLAWPLQGKIVTPFGTKDESGRPSSGILLATPSGTPVHVIARGRVAFADWLRGYGLMLIVDHGGGYMSLYGCNETLSRNVGDWVNAGDTIATSGASGGQKTPGLYFELRADGQAIDPRAWLQ